MNQTPIERDDQIQASIWTINGEVEKLLQFTRQYVYRRGCEEDERLAEAIDALIDAVGVLQGTC